MFTLVQLRRRFADHRREILGFAAALLVIGLIVGLTQQWWDDIYGFLQDLSAGWLIVGAAMLPLVGVSIVLIYLVIGARFGGGWGLVLIAGVTAWHLVATHLLAHHLFRRRVQAFLRRRRYRILRLGRESPAAFALLLSLVPGPPYFVRNYLLAFSGVPWRTTFLVAWPVYVVRSGVVLFLGDWARDPSPPRFLLLGGIGLGSVIVCLLAVRHLQRRYRHPDREARPLRSRAPGA